MTAMDAVARRRLPDVHATSAAGEALGRLVAGGDVIALIGELGAGKTSFTRGLAIGAGVDPDDVASPTFALVNEYGGRLAVAHADLYRLERERELDEIGWDDLVERRDAAIVIEWADRFPRRLPADHLRVTLAHDGDARVLEAEATGPRARALLDRWRAAGVGG